MTTRNPVTHADIRNVDPRRLLQRRMLSIDTASILPFDARDIIVGQRTATVVTIAEGPYMGFEAAILWANQWNNRDCYTFNFNHNGSQWRDISRLLRHYPTNSNLWVAFHLNLYLLTSFSIITSGIAQLRRWSVILSHLFVLISADTTARVIYTPSTGYDRCIIPPMTM